MVGEYRIALGWRIFLYVLAPIFIIGFGIATFLPFNDLPSNSIMNVLWRFLFAGLAIFMFYGLLETIYSKIVIDETSITEEGFRNKKRIDFNEIKGYKINEKFIELISDEPTPRKVQISTIHQSYYNLEAWIMGQWPDLDKMEAKQLETWLFDQWKISPELREKRMTQIKWMTWVINGIGVLSLIWAVFNPIPYTVSILTVASIVPICILTVYFFRGLVSLDEKKENPMPSVVYAFLFASLAFAYRMFVDYNLIFDNSEAWVMTCAGTFAIIYFLFKKTYEIRFRNAREIVTSISLSAFIFFYVLSLYVFLNCRFDSAQPTIYKSSVSEKKTTTGKSPSYSLILNPWGPVKEKDEITVSKDEYEAFEMNENVTIYLYPGRLATKWYYVGK